MIIDGGIFDWYVLPQSQENTSLLGDPAFQIAPVQVCLPQLFGLSVKMACDIVPGFFQVFLRPLFVAAAGFKQGDPRVADERIAEF